MKQSCLIMALASLAIFCGKPRFEASVTASPHGKLVKSTANIYGLVTKGAKIEDVTVRDLILARFLSGSHYTEREIKRFGEHYNISVEHLRGLVAYTKPRSAKTGYNVLSREELKDYCEWAANMIPDLSLPAGGQNNPDRNTGIIELFIEPDSQSGRSQKSVTLRASRRTLLDELSSQDGGKAKYGVTNPQGVVDEIQKEFKEMRSLLKDPNLRRIKDSGLFRDIKNDDFKLQTLFESVKARVYDSFNNPWEKFMKNKPVKYIAVTFSLIALAYALRYFEIVSQPADAVGRIFGFASYLWSGNTNVLPLIHPSSLFPSLLS